jgi:hypothetical protein
MNLTSTSSEDQEVQKESTLHGHETGGLNFHHHRCKNLKTSNNSGLLNQYSETNMMHFSFNLLRIKGLYMFRALLAHPQEALHKRHLVYWVRIMSVGCGTMKPTWCTFHSIYWESRVSTCFEHYLLILRRRSTSGTWYVASVLAAPGLKCSTILLFTQIYWHRTFYQCQKCIKFSFQFNVMSCTLTICSPNYK